MRRCERYRDAFTVAPGTPSNDVDSGCQQPAAFTATGPRGGIDWGTFNVNVVRSGPRPGTESKLDIQGKYHEVRTSDQHTVLTVFIPDAVDAQPAKMKAIIKAENREIGYNCYGYSFGATNVVLRDGRSVTAYTANKDVPKLLERSYTERTPAQAKEDLAKNKKVVMVFIDANGEYSHSAVPTTIVTNADSTENNMEKTLFKSKNGTNQFDNTKDWTGTELKKKYPGPTVK